MNSQAKDELPVHLGRAFFDAVSVPAFIVDEDVRILDYNAAGEKLLGFAPKSALRRRGGEVLHCVYAATLGCGKAKPCKRCIIRNSVKAAAKGKIINRKFHEAQLRHSRGVMTVSLLVSASLLPDTETPQVLLVLENVVETIHPSARRRAKA